MGVGARLVTGLGMRLDGVWHGLVQTLSFSR